MCLSPAARGHLPASISSLLSLLNFLMGTNTLLDEILTYFVVDFLQTKAVLTIKGVRKVLVRHLGNFDKLNLSIKLNRSG